MYNNICWIKKKNISKISTQNKLIASTEPLYVPSQPLYASPHLVYAPVQSQNYHLLQQLYNKSTTLAGQPNQ